MGDKWEDLRVGLQCRNGTVMLVPYEQLADLLAERDALLAACKALLCLSLPNDVSGRRMVDDAVAAVKNAEGV